MWYEDTITTNLKKRGATVIEYALLIDLIAVVAVVSMGFVGDSAFNPLDDSAEQMSNAIDESNIP